MSSIWYMESEFCEECGELLDYFGCCPDGCDFLFPGEEDEDEPDLDPDNLDFDEQGNEVVIVEGSKERFASAPGGLYRTQAPKQQESEEVA